MSVSYRFESGWQLQYLALRFLSRFYNILRLLLTGQVKWQDERERVRMNEWCTVVRYYSGVVCMSMKL